MVKKAFNLGKQHLANSNLKFKFPGSMKFKYMPRIQVFSCDGSDTMRLVLDTGLSVYSVAEHNSSYSAELFEDGTGVKVNIIGDGYEFKVVLLIEE